MWYRTEGWCTRLLLELAADKLNRQYMQQLRYVCEYRDRESVNRDILSSMVDSRSIAKLGDISLYATYFDCTVSEIDLDPGVLYDTFDDFEDKVAVATGLRHLNGIYYLFNGDSLTFYWRFDNIRSSILYAIEGRDTYAFCWLLSFSDSIKEVEQHHDNYLALAYLSESFDIAIQLLQHGAKFDIKHIVRVHPTLSYFEYKAHIDALASIISTTEVIGITSLVEAMFCFPAPPPTDGTILEKIDGLLHSPDDRIGGYIAQNVYYNDVTKYLFAISAAVVYPHAILPLTGVTLPFFSLENKLYCIYIPVNRYVYIVPHYVHELTHAILHVIYGSKPSPCEQLKLNDYTRHCQAFREAKQEFLQNVLTELWKQPTQGISYETAAAAHPLLSFHQYCYSSDREFQRSLLFMIIQEYRSKNWDGYLMFSDTSTTQFREAIMAVDKNFEKLLHMEKHLRSSEVRGKELVLGMLGEVMKDFGLSETQSLKEVMKYQKALDYITTSITDFCHKQQWTPQYSAFLNSIFDYFNRRSQREKESELLPKLAEVYTYSDDKVDSKVKKLYEPLLQYWEHMVVPLAEEVLHNHGVTTSSGDKSIFQVIYCYFSNDCDERPANLTVAEWASSLTCTSHIP